MRSEEVGAEAGAEVGASVQMQQEVGVREAEQDDNQTWRLRISDNKR